MIEPTVRDLISREGDDLFYSKLLNGRVIALSARTGKQLFDTSHNREEHIKKFYSCEVTSIWASQKERPNSGFSGTWYQPVTMLYIRD